MIAYIKSRHSKIWYENLDCRFQRKTDYVDIVVEENIPGNFTMIYVDVDSSLLPGSPSFYKYDCMVLESDIITIKPTKLRICRRKTPISLTLQPVGKRKFISRKMYPEQ